MDTNVIPPTNEPTPDMLAVSPIMEEVTQEQRVATAAEILPTQEATQGVPGNTEQPPKEEIATIATVPVNAEPKGLIVDTRDTTPEVTTTLATGDPATEHADREEKMFIEKNEAAHEKPKATP